MKSCGVSRTLCLIIQTNILVCRKNRRLSYCLRTQCKRLAPQFINTSSVRLAPDSFPSSSARGSQATRRGGQSATKICARFYCAGTVTRFQPRPHPWAARQIRFCRYSRNRATAKTVSVGAPRRSAPMAMASNARPYGVVGSADKGCTPIVRGRYGFARTLVTEPPQKSYRYYLNAPSPLWQ